ncbi:MAG: BTAD domain-containing putative transcriptional regulator [Caldilineaceae bacterium]
MLKIICLGAPQITSQATSQTTLLSADLTPKALALLLYLAVTGKSHSRDILAHLFWGEHSNQQARTNLRYLLPELRKRYRDHLLITAQTIGINCQASYWLDVDELRTTLSTDLATITTEGLQATVDLYQGEFLAGFYVRHAPAFEEWVTQQREELHGVAIRGLYALAQRYVAQSDTTRGLATTQRLLGYDPWHEAGHRLQMQLLVASGQRGAALSHYEHCRTILADELGVEPEAATTALYAQIRDSAYDEVAHAKATELVEVILSLPHNLPSQLTPFFGRETEIAQIGALLLSARYRLVTLVGEGGIGKTRLALAVARWLADSNSAGAPQLMHNPPPAIRHPPLFPDGIWFVALSAVTPTGNLEDKFAVAVAQAIGLSFGGTQPLFTQMLAHIHNKNLLLLLDNVEHLLPEVADFLVQLLQAAPAVTVLVTSRHLLGLQAAFVWRVTGLDIPPHADLPPSALLTYSSIALFVERASRRNRHFQITGENQAAIVAICRLVEGLPLAIELAAALIRQYTCDALYAALQHDYAVLATTYRDLPSRHRSIKAMLDYSWRFLQAEEARILAACSIFAGGFTASAAVTVTGATPALLTKLVDYSLLQVHEGRFLMHELVRHYAATQLGQFPEDRHAGLACHAAYYMALIHGLEATLLATFDAQGVVQSELENIRTAWLWSAAQNNLDLLAMGLESLQGFYRLAGLHQEAIYLLETALAATHQSLAAFAAHSAQQLLARLLCYTAQFYRGSGAVETGERLAQEALTVGQQVADPLLQGMAYHELARLAQVRSDFLTMHALAEQGCTQARLANLPQLTAECLNDLGIAISSCMHPRFAIPHFHEALHCLRDATNRYLEARVRGNLGFFHLSCHEYHLACRYLPQTLTQQRLLQDREGSMITQIFLGDLWMALGAYDQAQQEYEQVLTMVQTIHNPYWKSWLYTSYGHLQYLRGDLAAARNACTVAHQIALQGKSHVQAQWILLDLGHILTDQGDWQAAGQYYEQAIVLQAEIDWRYRTADAHAGLAGLLLAQGEVAAAMSHVEVALTHLKQEGIAVTKEPFRVYWTCVRVLQAAGDLRTAAVLQTANRALQEIAGALEDQALRHSLLKNVVVNRNLIAAAQAAGLT